MSEYGLVTIASRFSVKETLDLCKLEQEAGYLSGAENMILAYLYPGEDEAAKVREAMLKHGLGEDDSGRILVIQFVAADGNGPVLS